MVDIRELGGASRVRALSFSPDGRSVLVAKDWKPPQLHNLQLWDSDSGHKQKEFRLTYDPEDMSNPIYGLFLQTGVFGGNITNLPLMAIFGLNISPDGRLVALACGHDVRVFRIDFTVPQISHAATFRGHKDDVNYVLFSPDGSLVVSASADGTAIVWEVGSGRAIRKVGGGEIPLGAARITADNARLIIGGGTRSSGGYIWIWDVSTGACVKTISDFEPSIGCLDLSPDGETVAFSTSDGTVCILNLHSNSTDRFPRLPGSISALFYYADGSHIVCLSNTSASMIGDMAAIVSGGRVSICGRNLKRPRQLYAEKAGVICAAISRTRDVVAVGFGDNIRLIRISPTDVSGEANSKSWFKRFLGHQ